jgi:hypothetical protein
MGINTSFAVTGSKADVTPPKLLDLTLPATIDLSAGSRTVNFGVKATDGDGSGVTEVVVWTDKKATTSLGTYDLFLIGSFGDTFRDSTPGSASSSFTFDPATAPGTYNITRVDLTDLAGNKASYTPAQLAAMGINTSFAVTDGTTPILTKPSATVLPTTASGELALALVSSDWVPAASNSVSLVVNYNPMQAHFDTVSLSSGASSFSTRVSEAGTVGTVTISGTGATPAEVQAALKLTLDLAGDAGLVSYSIDAFTVNGKAQTLGQAKAGSIYQGSAGADSLANADGVTFIEGGAGIDTVKYTGARADYVIHKTGAGFTLQGHDGNVATLSHVERAVFGDQCVALDIDGNGGQVYRLYQAAFDRQPDAAGIGFWLHQMDTGTSLLDTAQAFISSQEFIKMYGANASDTAFVSALYQNILHRLPDQAGFDFWINAISHGADRASTLVQFSESGENVAQVLGSIQDGFGYIAWH